MAISWGGYAGHLRVGIDFWISPGTVGTNTSSVTVTVVFYVQPQPGSSHAYNGTMWYSGDRAGSFGYSINQWNTTHVQEVGRISYSVGTSYAGAVSAYLAASTVVVWNGGAPGTTRNQTIGRRPYRAPRAPRNVKAVRNSDSRSTVTWDTNYDSASGAQPWTNVSIDRWSKSTGKWSRVATVSWSVTSWSDTGVRANDEYKYRVRSNNSAGSSGWVNTASIYTTPAAPSNVTAEKVGTNIVVKWRDNSRYNTGFDVYDNGTLIGSASANTLTYTHSNPSTTTTHQYHIIAKAGGLRSAASSKSNVVQLLAKPNPPGGLTPNGPQGIMLGEAVVFSWKHNPTDSSAQRIYEIEIRKTGGTWRSLGAKTTSTSSVELDASDATPSVGDFEWRVRTWGSFSTASDYSAVATYKVATQPTVTINSPESDTTLVSSVARLGWGYAQGEGQAQVAVEIILLDTTTGTNAVAFSGRVDTEETQLTLPHALSDASTYKVSIRALSSSGLWSEWDSTDVKVVYAKPKPPTVEATFNPENGDILVDVSNPPETTTELDVTHNTVWRNINAESAWNRLKGETLPEAAINSFTNPSFEALPDTTQVIRTNRLITPAYVTRTLELGAAGVQQPLSGVEGAWRLGDVPSFGSTLQVFDYRFLPATPDGHMKFNMHAPNGIGGAFPLISTTTPMPATPGSTWSGSWSVNRWFNQSSDSSWANVAIGVWWHMSNGTKVWESPNTNDAYVFGLDDEFDPDIKATLKFEGLIAPNNVVGVSFGLRVGAVGTLGNWASLFGVYDDAIFMNTPTLDGPSFNGFTPAAGGLSYAWMGQPNLSASQELKVAGGEWHDAIARNIVSNPKTSIDVPGWERHPGTYAFTAYPGRGFVILEMYGTVPLNEVLLKTKKPLELSRQVDAGQSTMLSAAVTVALSSDDEVPVRIALQLPGGYTGEAVLVYPDEPVTLRVHGPAVSAGGSHSLNDLGIVLTEAPPDGWVGIQIYDSLSVYEAIGPMPVAVGEMSNVEGGFTSNWWGEANSSVTLVFGQRPTGVLSSSAAFTGEKYAASWRSPASAFEGGYSLATISPGVYDADGPVMGPEEIPYEFTPIPLPRLTDPKVGDIVTVMVMARRAPGYETMNIGSFVYNNSMTSKPSGEKYIGTLIDNVRDLDTTWTKLMVEIVVDTEFIAGNNTPHGNKRIMIILGGGRSFSTPVYYDLLTVVHRSTVYEGDPFSGDTARIDPTGFLTTAEWVGTPHESQSTYSYSWPAFEESEWELVADNVPPNTAITDREGRTWGPTVYLVQAFTGVPSMNQSIDVVRASSYYAWFNTGADFSEFFAIPYNVEISEDIEIANQKAYIFDGRKKPVVISGDGVERSFKVRGMLDPQDVRGSEFTDVSRVAERPGLFLYRDMDGRRLYVTVQGVSIDRETRHLREVSVNILEVDSGK